MNFKILHRRMVTNTKHKIKGMKESDLCELRDDKAETQEHALLECMYTRELWLDIEKWCTEVCRKSIELNDWQRLLGDPELNKSINVIIQIAKVVIYKSRQYESSKFPARYPWTIPSA